MAITKVTNSVVGSGSATDGYVLTADGSGNSVWEAVAGGPTFKTFGTNSIMIGSNSTGTINAADYNTAVSTTAFAALTTGDFNVAFGEQALDALTTGGGNTALGVATLGALTTANNNTAVGISALTSTTDGTVNTAVGSDAMAANTTGSYNVAVGSLALDAMTTVNSNTAVGYNAGGSVTTGSLNTFIGSLAGDNTTTGTGNLAVGYAMRTSATGNVRGHIGYNNGDTGTADYAITFGRSGTDWSRLSYGGSSFTTGSDERKKKDITDHPLGLDFINKLRTVNYHIKAPCDVPEEWDTHQPHETEAKITTWQTGMLAQEVKAALDNLGVDAEKFNGWGQEPDGMQTLDYGQFVMPLIKALQEADDKIDALTTRIETLENA